MKKGTLHRARKSLHKHPTPNVPCAYCICGTAIVQVAGVWWHLGKVDAKAPYDTGPHAKQGVPDAK